MKVALIGSRRYLNRILEWFVRFLGDVSGRIQEYLKERDSTVYCKLQRCFVRFLEDILQGWEFALSLFSIPFF